MLQVQPINPCNLTESQVYEDLSQIIKSFKNLLTLMESIAGSLHRFESIQQHIQGLKGALKILQGFIRQYSYVIGQESQHKNTFHRFICRLIESISAYKLKFQSLPYYNLLSFEIKEIEQVVMSYQQDKNVGLIIKKLYSVMTRFCSKSVKSCQIFTRKSQNELQPSALSKKSQFTSITHEYQTNEGQASPFTFTINELRPKKVIESRSQNSLSKVMTLLNRRYRTLSCLDIEYQQFKQLFFRSRDTKEDLFEDCFQRNGFIHREMLRYSKQFSQYLQKRQVKIYRKNKFVDSLTANNLKAKSKASETEETNYNFMKKKHPNDSRRTFYQNHFLQPQAEIQSEECSPIMMARSQLLQDKPIHLTSIEYAENTSMTPQLRQDHKQQRNLHILPLMLNAQLLLQQKEQVEDFNSQSFLQLSKRKKNLQLKKIDISLTSFSNGIGNSLQSANLKNRNLKVQNFKRSSVQTTKQMEQKINASIRKNYLQKKYESAMRKNKFENIPQSNKNDQQPEQVIPSKFSSTKYIDLEREQGSPCHKTQQRKYLIKTSNKRSLNPNAQFKSLNPSSNQGKQISTVKNFRKLKVQQIQKIEKLGKMKETALNFMQIASGGKAIKPLPIRQNQLIQNLYTQAVESEQQDAIKPYSQKEF